MSKIIKIFLTQGFTPVDHRVFKLGTTIGFDCYIQRFNGFFIVLESGTFVDEKVYRLLTQKNLQLFVQTKKYQAYKMYVDRNAPLNHDADMAHESEHGLSDAIAYCNDIRTVLKNQSTMHDRLQVIYTYSQYLIQSWLEQEIHVVLPMEALSKIVEEFVPIANSERLTLSKFNDFLDNKDDLSAHLVNVMFFAAIIGSQIGLDFTDQEKLLTSALLHDIGKSELDEALLKKSDFLSEREYHHMQRHADASASIVQKSGLKDRVIVHAIKEHHERLDGSGYPKGLHDEYITQFGKIIAVCDVFDALITIKPYRGAYSTYNALQLMRSAEKERLDMKYINVLIKCLH